HNGNANSNGVGMQINGNNNLVDSSDVFGNAGVGIQVGASNNLVSGNTVKKADVGDKGKGNGGDGVNVWGSGNTLSEIDAYSNGGNGITVNGIGNPLLK